MIQPTMDRAAIEIRAQQILAEVDGDALALAKLLAKSEAQRVITVRLPASFHDALIEQADAERTPEQRMSLNQLCVRRLMLGSVEAAARRAAERELMSAPLAIAGAG